MPWSRIAPPAATVCTERNKVVLARLRVRLKQVERQIDAELARLVAEDTAPAHRFGPLPSIPGIGPVAATAMPAETPERGTMDGKETASLAGLAPITRERGKCKGQSLIGGGRHRPRRALCMPALVVTRHNPPLGQTCQALCSAGKPAKVAITAVMRKLIIRANALIRDDRKRAQAAPWARRMTSAPGTATVCPPVVAQIREFEALALLPEGSAIAEMLANYPVLRDQTRSRSRR